MKTLLITFTILMSTVFFAFSQSFLDLTKKQINHRLYLDKKYQFEKTETDTTLTITTNDPKLKQTTVIFHFDNLGKCDYEKTIYQCDECFEERLKAILTPKWRKVNGYYYVARHMELYTGNHDQPLAYLIKRTK